MSWNQSLIYYYTVTPEVHNRYLRNQKEYLIPKISETFVTRDGEIIIKIKLDPSGLAMFEIHLDLLPYHKTVATQWLTDLSYSISQQEEFPDRDSLGTHALLLQNTHLFRQWQTHVCQDQFHIQSYITL